MNDSPELWRSQFVVGPGLPDLNELGLVRHSVGSLDLWSSPALTPTTSGVVTILGNAEPITSTDIAGHFAGTHSGSTPEEIAELGLDLVGRYVLVADLATGAIVVPDVIASRRVFLSADGLVASSSERLLDDLGVAPCELTPAARAIREHPGLVRREFATFGLHSAFSGYRLLLANRVANLRTGRIELCSPATRRTPVGLSEAAHTLRAVARGLAALGDVELGLTGGFDSRVLLAAFAAESIDIETFTFVDEGEKKRHDADVAAQLAAAAGVRHERVPEPDPDPSILGLLEASQPIVRKLPHVLAHLTYLSQRSEHRITINGVGGEVSRPRYAVFPKRLPHWAARRIITGHHPAAHDLEAFDAWRNDRYASSAGDTHLDLASMHYWEQRLPIWGAQFVAEKDLFADEVAGFCCGRLQQQLISFPDRERSSVLGSSIFLQLIDELSPEIARLDPPPSVPPKLLAYDATPLPRFVRTLRPGWGT